jgi:membrane-associated phospholipid phosphatase
MRPLAALLLAPSLAAAAPAPQAAVEDFLVQTASVAAWPIQLAPAEWAALGGATAGTIFLLRADPHLYRGVSRLQWTLHRKSVFHATLLLGDGLVDLAGFGAFALGGPQAQRTARAGVEALAAVGLTSLILKHVFRVQRPQSDPARKSYFQGWREDAFPSGHTMSAFATAAVIAASYPAAAPFAYGVASLVGLSVMRRGWHWPSDVLAGGALGILIGRVSTRVNGHDLRIVPSGAGAAISADL